MNVIRDAAQRWHSFTFQIARTKNGETQWWVDIFILDRILRDILEAEQAEVSLWRIHRRGEGGGHEQEFTLECRTYKEAADRIDKRIRENAGYTFLDSHKLMKYVRPKPVAKPDGLSETNWPAELKKAWPYYIHGVSKMFLEFAEQMKVRTQKESPDLNYDTLDIGQMAK